MNCFARIIDYFHIYSPLWQEFSIHPSICINNIYSEIYLLYVLTGFSVLGWARFSNLLRHLRLFYSGKLKTKSDPVLSFIFTISLKPKFSFKIYRLRSVWNFFLGLNPEQDPVSLEKWFRFFLRVGSTTLRFIAISGRNTNIRPAEPQPLI